VLDASSSSSPTKAESSSASLSSATGLIQGEVAQIGQSQASHWAMPLVWKFFKRFTLGQLTMLLPDGTQRQLGGSVGQAELALWPSLKAHMHIVDARFFSMILKSGDIGLAEAFIAGYWHSDNVVAVIRWFILNTLHAYPKGNMNGAWQVNLARWVNRFQHRLRPNTVTGSLANIQAHYDLSNPFFQLFLDPSMAYSSGKFLALNDDLETAQQQKFESLCQKLRLRPTDHLLEIGSGWGGLAVYAAAQFGCRVTTVTVSKAQYDGALDRVKQAGLTHLVQVQLCDYRQLTGQYDKLVSVEMIEAVGDAYYETFFAQCQALLKPHGLMVLQMITCPDDRYELVKGHVDFIQKYIFPGSLLPSLHRVQLALRRTGDWFLHELEDLGNSYARTLALWNQNLQAQQQQVLNMGFDEAFVRKWHYYLQYCEAAFATRNITVVQVVYTRPNNPLLVEALAWD
jgi:cyclopropane-fatty-acyl-phospholipid synthase